MRALLNDAANVCAETARVEAKCETCVEPVLKPSDERRLSKW